jgi:hypothetical protein
LGIFLLGLVLDSILVLSSALFIFSVLEALLVLSIFLLLVFIVVVDTGEVVVLEVVFTLARKLNGDELVTGMVLKPVNVPNAFFKLAS